MKKVNVFLLALLSMTVGCSENKTTSDDEFISIDVTANYPKKDILLQDFMEVEYIPLETTDEFLVKGKVADIGKDILVLTNTRQGEILLFDRSTGKGLKKINRRGQGPEEYILPFNVYLNKEENELIVNDGPASRIQIYDLDGNYKMTVPYKKGALVTSLYDYDADHFLSQDIYALGNETSTSSFLLMSKQDGMRTDINVPYEKRISPIITKQVGDQILFSAPKVGFIAYLQGDWILTEPSADTIYKHRPNGYLRPFIVRTPSVQQMNPEVFLFPGILTSRYYFMQAVTKECNFEKEETDMPTADLVYDTQEKKTYEYTVLNADFDKRKEDLSGCALNDEVAFVSLLEADELIEADKEGKLKGNLKQIASGLGENDNPVVMLAKYKDK